MHYFFMTYTVYHPDSSQNYNLMIKLKLFSLIYLHIIEKLIDAVGFGLGNPCEKSCFFKCENSSK